MCFIQFPPVNGLKTVLFPAQDKDAENRHAVAKTETLGNKLHKPSCPPSSE